MTQRQDMDPVPFHKEFQWNQVNSIFLIKLTSCFLFVIQFTLDNWDP